MDESGWARLLQAERAAYAKAWKFDHWWELQEVRQKTKKENKTTSEVLKYLNGAT